MNRLLIQITVAVALVGRLAAAQIVPTTYTYINGLVPYGLQDNGNDLLDGLYGDMNPGVNLAAPDPSGWVEFGGAGEMKFSFADNLTITNIVLSMARWEPAAIYLPDVIKVNGSTYIGDAGSSPDMNRAFISIDGNWTGSDLTLFVSHLQYLFIDEVSFSGPTPVPEPSAGALLGAGLIGLLLAHRARGQAKQQPNGTHA